MILPHARCERRSPRPGWALLAVVVGCWAGRLQAGDDAVWHPARTRVCIVSVAQFQSGRLHSFTPSDRLDGRLVELLKERGVPASQILFLKDERAATHIVQSEFTSFLRKSRPDELLIFLFSSHGGYDSKTDTYTFYTYDDELPFTWALDAIERDFQRKHALLFTDCCCSGGIVELAATRKAPIAYACLSSTSGHQTAWSGWRFIQCLNRALAGDPVVDLNSDGQIVLDELAGYQMNVVDVIDAPWRGWLVSPCGRWGFDPRKGVLLRAPL